jgi:hypothetical protein
MTAAEKLSIHAGTRLWFEPTEWMRVLGPLPRGVTMTADFAAATVSVMFVSHPDAVRWLVRRYGTVLGVPAMVWLAYPTHGLPTFNRASLDQLLAGHRLTVVAEAPLDGTWTAVRVRPAALVHHPPVTPTR